MFYTFMIFVLQLGAVSLLVASFIALQLLLRALKSRKQHQEKERLSAERQDGDQRRERRNFGDRKAMPGRTAKPLASLANVPMRRSEPKTAFGRKANI